MLILIIAFFKVFVFSREIVEHKKRINPTKEVKGVDFNVGSSYSWKDLISQKEKRNSDDIKNLSSNVNSLEAVVEKNNKSLKKIIIENGNKIEKSTSTSIGRLKDEFYGYVNKNNVELSKQIKKIKKLKNNTSSNKIDGTILNMPENIASIKNKANKIINGIIVDLNNTTSKKRTKKNITKELQEKDKEIYTSIEIETVNTDSSNFDVVTTSHSDENKTLPPIILRQGMTNGVLVTGVSAPTFSQKSQAAPVVLTFKGKSIISNMFEQDVENCMATGSVFGNIITRRAEILINKISCTFVKNNEHYMVRSNVKGWVYDGYDGRLGIPGILVDSSGSIIDDSVLIGLLQGFGKFLSSSASIYATQGQSAVTTTGAPIYSPGQVAKTNIAAGVGNQLSSGFDTITGYYQKIIDSLYPYIDIKGGRKVSILFDGGEVLTPKKYTPFMVNENHDTSTNKNGESEATDDMDREVSIEDW